MPSAACVAAHPRHATAASRQPRRRRHRRSGGCSCRARCSGRVVGDAGAAASPVRSALFAGVFAHGADRPRCCGRPRRQACRIGVSRQPVALCFCSVHATVIGWRCVPDADSWLCCCAVRAAVLRTAPPLAVPSVCRALSFSLWHACGLLRVSVGSALSAVVAVHARRAVASSALIGGSVLQRVGCAGRAAEVRAASHAAGDAAGDARAASSRSCGRRRAGLCCCCTRCGRRSTNARLRRWEGGDGGDCHGALAAEH